MTAGSTDKPLVWLSGEIRTPPFSRAARIEVGYLLRKLQRGESLGLPWSRPMPAIGPNCHELRVTDEGNAWRVIYCISQDAIVILDVFAKKAERTPARVIALCKRRLRLYEVP